MPRKRHVSRNVYLCFVHSMFKSCLARGMWVEILCHPARYHGMMSCLARGMWVEIGYSNFITHTDLSCLARGMWVEIKCWDCSKLNRPVMPRKRHVSRNCNTLRSLRNPCVMPRKRHVSRNLQNPCCMPSERVMPRKRHVSRNHIRYLKILE